MKMDESLADLLTRLTEEWKMKISVDEGAQQVGYEQNSLVFH